MTTEHKAISNTVGDTITILEQQKRGLIIALKTNKDSEAYHLESRNGYDIVEQQSKWEFHQSMISYHKGKIEAYIASIQAIDYAITDVKSLTINE